MSTASTRIPSLDGLRAISIGMVVVSHLTVGYDRWLDVGNLGVRVFFVISGYLITTLLLAEVAKTRTISLRGFYLRRIARIFPAFYAFLAVMLVLDATGAIALAPSDTIAAFTYTMNYHYDRSWYVGHIWSLSVEEQFYLLWPALLLLAGVRRGLLVAAAFVVLAPLIRVATWYLLPEQRIGIGESFQTIFDAIATGCLLAGVRRWLSGQPRYLAALRSPWFVFVPLLAFGCNYMKGHAITDFLVGETLTNLAIALCIDRWVRWPDDRVGRLLNTRPMIFVGGLSYSLYLWQQVFVEKHRAWAVQKLPLNLVCMVGAALASYYLIEQPVLRLRARLR